MFHWIFLKLITALIIILNLSVTLQLEDQPCSLPDGKRQSTCIRLHRCDSFQNQIKLYGGKRPPLDVVQNINNHICDGGGFVCCPDNAFESVPSSPQTEPLQLPSHQNLPAEISNPNALKNHPNFNQINAKSCGTSSTNRIINGVDAELFEIPWAVVLGYVMRLGGELVWRCGGTLISQQFVLTAAHCARTDELKYVRLGEHTISSQRDCDEFDTCADPLQDILIEKRINHPKFNRQDKINDIALLKLKTPADISKNNVKTVCLPIDEENRFDNKEIIGNKFTIFGWGKIGKNYMESDVLQKAYVPFVALQDCAKRYASYNNLRIYPTYLCAGGTKTKTDTCKGDSGSGITALSVLANRPKIFIYGVVSGGAECENPDVTLPGIYTNIRYYLDWILDNMS